ncbi:MAG: pdhA [Rickettsiaceae bacterium]|jgi:pyruvate dehydrogenase E1 component alpha subunit|nr:pdhA [Rickettsiaceae bacterium]
MKKNKNNSSYELSPSQLLEAYEKMLLIRRFEEKCGQIYGMGLIGGFCHLYIGQEAVVTGLEFAKQKGDASITSYRDHGHIILAGTEPKYVLAELMGRATGCSKGKGGSMHMFDVPGKFFGGHGIVGAQIPLGTGIAFAEKYNGTDNICHTYMGDGAVHQGQVYEAFNMAALWKLPVLYIIENNQYAMGTSVKRSTVVTELYKKGESFGIPGERVDGMNFEEVYNAAMRASEYVRSGKGPYILEMLTYRFRGHSMSDPAKYRTKEEVACYKDEKDPIEQLKKAILSRKFATEEDIKNIEKKVKDIVAEAVEFSNNSPEPEISELYTDVYSN